jgi:hypothetical protein
VAQTLHGASPEEGYRRLLENPDRLAGDVERSWQTFVEGKMDEYFAGVPLVLGPAQAQPDRGKR